MALNLEALVCLDVRPQTHPGGGGLGPHGAAVFLHDLLIDEQARRRQVLEPARQLYAHVLVGQARIRHAS